MKVCHQSQRSRNIVILFVVSVALLWPLHSTGEEWTAEQKEVWNLVQTGWDILKNKDAEAMVANMPGNAVIWWGSNTAPHRVELLKSVYERWFHYEQSISIELQPLRIEIFNDVAVVAYYGTWKGERRSNRSKILEVFLKQDDTWMQIGSLSSSCDRLGKCLQ